MVTQSQPRPQLLTVAAAIIMSPGPAWDAEIIAGIFGRIIGSDHSFFRALLIRKLELRTNLSSESAGPAGELERTEDPQSARELKLTV